MTVKTTSLSGAHTHTYEAIPGPIGPAGAKGDKGDKGDTGLTGAQGVQGVAGAEGSATSFRPFPAPVTTRTVTVPATIDATGASDVSTALQSFIYSVPDGSLINFPPTAIYRIDAAVQIGPARHNLILDGNGCTLRNLDETKYALPLLKDSSTDGSDIWIRNFVLIGSEDPSGVFTPGMGGGHGVAVRSSRFEVSGCTISAVWGDGIYVNSPLGYPISDVWIHDNHIVSVDRNGVSIIWGTNILIERNVLDVSGWCTFDIEGNDVSQASSSVTFRDNTAGTWSYAFLAVGGLAGAPVDKIVVDGNTVTGGSIKAYIGNGTNPTHMTRITFTNNKGTVAAGPVITASRVDGLTITGNVQPTSAAPVLNVTDCTGKTLQT